MGMRQEHELLGQILVRQKKLGHHELMSALSTQMVFGGRLGTNLVELEMVGIDELGEALAAQRGVELADGDMLASAEHGALAFMPLQLAQACCAIPLRHDALKDELHVAMIDPSRGAVSQLAQQLKCRIKAYIAPELRMRYFLEQHYGILRPPRFLRVPDGGERQARRRRYLEATVALPEEAQLLTTRQESDTDERQTRSSGSYVVVAPLTETGRRELERGTHHLGAATSLPGGRKSRKTNSVFIKRDVSPTRDLVPATGGRDGTKPRAVDLVVHELDRVNTGGGLARLLVSPLTPETATSVLFWVRGKMAIGCCAHGVPTTLEQLQRLTISLEEPSLLQWALRVEGVVRARGRQDEMQHQIARHINASPPSDVAVAPVLLDAKVVNLIVVHSQGKWLSEQIVPDLRLLTRAATRAYEKLRPKAKQR